MAGFTISLESIYNNSLFFVKKRSSACAYFTYQASSPGLPSHLSLTIPKKKKKKAITSTCRDGTLKNQPMGMTLHYFYTTSTSCAMLPTMYTELFTCTLVYSHLLKEYITRQLIMCHIQQQQKFTTLLCAQITNTNKA